jgi:hypothetical protein
LGHRALQPFGFQPTVHPAVISAALKDAQKGKAMALPTEPSQKIKPLLIALSVIGAIIVLITQAPTFVRYLSS